MNESDPEVTLAMRNALNRLQLAEDYCDMFDRLVDMSEIASFGDPGEKSPLPGVVDMATAYSRALIYPGATAFAYINEIELRQIRARSRVFGQTNPYAIGAARNRMAYVVGSGHTYKVLPREPDEADEDLLANCRKVLEDFRKRNKWDKRQKETVRRLDRDGERFLRLFADEEAGELNVRFVEPLEVQNPPDRTAADGVYFGIEFKRIANGDDLPVYDIETPVHYFLVNIGTLGEVTSLRESVPAGQMQHLKANVDLTWPRGLPTWYALQSHLTDAVRTLKATGKIVEFRARIGMIRRHINGAKETVRDFAQCKADGDGRIKTAAQYPYAAIIDTSNATEYQFPSETAPVDKNVAAIQAELRACAAALAMPEYMLSGDASKANFSSTMVAEGPAVKTFEEMQADLVEADVEIMERQLTIAAKAGLIRGATGEDILELVKVEAEPPIIKSENRLQEAQADQILLQARVMSKETMAARHGLVYADERDKMEMETGEETAGDRVDVPPSQPPPGENPPK
ncbi:MAG: phage portal protein [Thermoguttaceae bacterium]|jgi:capsid protein